MLDLPVFETLLTIFMFGLVICGIVYLGYQDAKESGERNQNAEQFTLRFEESEQEYVHQSERKRGVAV